MRRGVFLLIIIFLASWIRVGAQDDPFDSIVKAFKGSDAKGLSDFFNITIELGLPDNENTYSALQGEMIMKDFFRKYPPDSFLIVQKGTTDAISKFAICSYVSGERQYQVYIYLRKEKEKYLIHKIRFEEKKK